MDIGIWNLFGIWCLFIGILTICNSIKKAHRDPVGLVITFLIYSMFMVYSARLRIVYEPVYDGDNDVYG